jgi:hypothetical protein
MQRHPLFGVGKLWCVCIAFCDGTPLVRDDKFEEQEEEELESEYAKATECHGFVACPPFAALLYAWHAR